MELSQARAIPQEHLPIAETFVSIQGEGKLAGVASYFVRVSGCNLRCSWCDTPYASWSPEGGPRPIRDLLDEAARSKVRHAVVTGGEPMLFAGVVPLCRGLRERGLHVTIETAGTTTPGVPVTCDLLSLSPKLSNSTPRNDPRDLSGAWTARHESRRIDPGVLQRLLDEHPQRQLKFVVREPGDLAEIEALLSRLTGWKDDDVLLMPEGITTPTPQRRDWIVRACLDRAWRYAPRLHIELFGNRRGT